MSGFILTDGTNVASLNPEWDLKFADKKIEDVHRTRTGTAYRYKWGQYHATKFSVEYVNSATMCQVNSWWGANTALALYDASSALVHSGYLANASKPIAEYVKPYIDQFKGIIELEGA